MVVHSEEEEEEGPAASSPVPAAPSKPESTAGVPQHPTLIGKEPSSASEVESVEEEIEVEVEGGASVSGLQESLELGAFAPAATGGQLQQQSAAAPPREDAPAVSGQQESLELGTLARAPAAAREEEEEEGPAVSLPAAAAARSIEGEEEEDQATAATAESPALPPAAAAAHSVFAQEEAQASIEMSPTHSLSGEESLIVESEPSQPSLTREISGVPSMPLTLIPNEPEQPELLVGLGAEWGGVPGGSASLRRELSRERSQRTLSPELSQHSPEAMSPQGGISPEHSASQAPEFGRELSGEGSTGASAGTSSTQPPPPPPPLGKESSQPELLGKERSQRSFGQLPLTEPLSRELSRERSLTREKSERSEESERLGREKSERSEAAYDDYSMSFDEGMEEDEEIVVDAKHAVHAEPASAAAEPAMTRAEMVDEVVGRTLDATLAESVEVGVLLHRYGLCRGCVSLHAILHAAHMHTHIRACAHTHRSLWAWQAA